MEFEVYKYIFTEGENDGYNQYKISECSILTDFGEAKKNNEIILSFSIPEWKNVKRFARLILTPEEAKALKEQL